MAHDLENPRTRKYSKLKSFIRNLELILRKSFLFFFVLINFIFHYKKSNYIDIEDYKDKDTRFINYLFFSLKDEYNFSYDLSFSVLDFVKKIGIRNFILHSSPNIFIKNKNKIQFSLNKKNFDKNELNFSTNYFGNIKETHLFLPYYIYPKLYNTDYDNLRILNKNKKKIKILFSGSTNKEVYGKFKWLDKNGVKLLNRVEIIDFIIENFENKIFFLKSYNDLSRIDFLKTPIVLSLNNSLIKKSNTNLTNKQHFEVISKSQFLLTAPGADMPLCHHLIEGIKMRSIPISNYANLHKPIIPEDSYLHFTSYETLKNSINEALNMSDENIFVKQKKLDKFYSNELSPNSFLKSFKERTTNEIVACNDVESLRWLQK